MKPNDQTSRLLLLLSLVIVSLQLLISSSNNSIHTATVDASPVPSSPSLSRNHLWRRSVSDDDSYNDPLEDDEEDQQQPQEKGLLDAILGGGGGAAGGGGGGSILGDDTSNDSNDKTLNGAPLAIPPNIRNRNNVYNQNHAYIPGNDGSPVGERYVQYEKVSGHPSQMSPQAKATIKRISRAIRAGASMIRNVFKRLGKFGLFGGGIDEGGWMGGLMRGMFGGEGASDITSDDGDSLFGSSYAPASILPVNPPQQQPSYSSLQGDDAFLFGRPSSGSTTYQPPSSPSYTQPQQQPEQQPRQKLEGDDAFLFSPGQSPPPSYTPPQQLPPPSYSTPKRDLQGDDAFLFSPSPPSQTYSPSSPSSNNEDSSATNYELAQRIRRIAYMRRRFIMAFRQRFRRALAKRLRNVFKRHMKLLFGLLKEARDHLKGRATKVSGAGDGATTSSSSSGVGFAAVGDKKESPVKQENV